MKKHLNKKEMSISNTKAQFIKEMNEKIEKIENELSEIKNQVKRFEETNEYYPSVKYLESVMINPDDDWIRIIKVLNTKIEDYDFAVRTRNCLKSYEYICIADILYYGENSILRIRNSGKQTLIDIKKVLEKQGLKFPYVKPPEKINEEFARKIRKLLNLNY